MSLNNVKLPASVMINLKDSHEYYPINLEEVLDNNEFVTSLLGIFSLLVISR